MNEINVAPVELMPMFAIHATMSAVAEIKNKEGEQVGPTCRFRQEQDQQNPCSAYPRGLDGGSDSVNLVDDHCQANWDKAAENVEDQVAQLVQARLVAEDEVHDVTEELEEVREDINGLLASYQDRSDGCWKVFSVAVEIAGNRTF